MTYTIQIDLEIDCDEIIEDDAIEQHLKNELSDSPIVLSNIRIIDINN